MALVKLFATEAPASIADSILTTLQSKQSNTLFTLENNGITSNRSLFNSINNTIYLNYFIYLMDMTPMLINWYLIPAKKFLVISIRHSYPIFVKRYKNKYSKKRVPSEKQ